MEEIINVNYTLAKSVCKDFKLSKKEYFVSEPKYKKIKNCINHKNEKKTNIHE